MSLRLFRFDSAVYQRLVDEGYKYILIDQTKEPKYFYDPRERKLQLLKAIVSNEFVPENYCCEPISSDTVNRFLSDADTDYYVIVLDNAQAGAA